MANAKPVLLLLGISVLLMLSYTAQAGQNYQCPGMENVRYYNGMFAADTHYGKSKVKWESIQVYPNELLVITRFRQAAINGCQGGQCQVSCTYNLDGNREVSLTVPVNQYHTTGAGQGNWQNGSCKARYAKRCKFQFAPSNAKLAARQ